MSFAGQIVRFPIAADAERGARAADGFAGPLARLIKGAAGSSNYLALLMRKESDWLASVQDRDADSALEEAMMLEDGDVAVSLRQAKRRTALICGLLDLGGVWSTMQVTGALTRFADKAVEAALREALSREITRGKLDAGADGTGGFSVLAMGKMGAFELNYSSDIDIVCLFDETRHSPEDYASVRASFLRVTKRMVRTLAEVTAEGYVFRTDLRLRPDPSVTPVCIAMEAAERYYESAGRTWERAAFIKARACAGDIPAGEAFLKRLVPFKFRKHLDFAAIRDAEAMLDKIRTHKGLAGPLDVAGHDLKLGQGGIREIEFFAQSRQLILGGRNPELRGRGTLEVLKALADGGWIGRDRSEQLQHAYLRLRDIEHRVQMLDDAQTHNVPRQPEQRARVAALDAASDLESFDATLTDLLREVHAATAPTRVTDEGGAEDDVPLARDPAVRQLLDGWHKLPATRSRRADELLTKLEPVILRRMAEAADPQNALAQFDGFLRGLPAGVQVFSMLDANPPLLALLVDICATAPALARYLGRNSAVFDAVIDRDFFLPLPGRVALEEELTGLLAASEDYEAALDDTRRWQKEQHFRIGVHLLRGLADVAGAERAYSDLAEASVAALLPAVIAHHARRHGPPPGGGLSILGMGRLGSAEMTAGSDLDLIVIYDADPDGTSDGAAPLAVGTYYARLTKRLISALTAPTAAGRLYEVDMRLRPSGRQGPVAISLASFHRYQIEEAWTWEHLALTRARAIAGPVELTARVDAAIRDVMGRPRDGAGIVKDVRDMRRRLLEARGQSAADPWEVKQGPGRLLDIDLYNQTRALMGQGPDPALSASRGRLATLQAVGRVAFAEGYTPERAGVALTQRVLELTDLASVDLLEATLQDDAARARIIIETGLEELASRGS